MDPLTLVASIPSPSTNTLGPFNLYGLCIALGVLAAVWIAMRRWEERGGDPDDIGTIAMWAVPAGVVGSRIYHVVTDWKLYRDDWVGAFKITEGGLGIPGGIAAGVLAGLVVVRVKKLPIRPLFDSAAPAIPVAQAIGRFGNWFNQEVFGRPTDLPWGLEIDPAHRPVGYEDAATFHPTFLYEGLWNVALAGLIVVLGRRRRLPPGHLFTVYVLGYAVGRLWVEMLRSDPASLIFGVRINIWMSLIVGAAALLVLVLARTRAPSDIPGSAYLASTGGENGAVEQPGSDADAVEEPGDDAAGTVDGGGDAEAIGDGDGGDGDGEAIGDGDGGEVDAGADPDLRGRPNEPEDRRS